MPDLGNARRLIAYNRAVFEKFLKAVEKRGWKAATTNQGIAHLSLKNTLVHILNAQEVWLVVAAQNRWEIVDDPRRRPDEVGSWKELHDYRDRVWAGMDSTLSGLTEADLGRRVQVPWMPGTYTLEDGVFQSSFEQAHHLGEIIGVFWQADWKPPEMTWIPNVAATARDFRPVRTRDGR
jgi:uncharacterized damage-inducible protein DinB